MGTDLLPTMLDELNVPSPPDRVLDGKSIAASLRGGPSPHEVLYHYAAGTLMAVRSATHKYRDRKAVAYPTDPVRLPIWQAHGPWLFDMRADPQEAYDISMQQTGYGGAHESAARCQKCRNEKNPRGWKSQIANKAIIGGQVIFWRKMTIKSLKITQIYHAG